MNWTIVFGVLLLVAWSLLLLILGMAAGKEAEKKEAVQNTYNQHIEPGSPGPPGADGAVGPRGEPGPPGRPGKTPTAWDLIVDVDHDLTLAEWKAAVEARLTRVEKKAGLSV